MNFLIFYDLSRIVKNHKNHKFDEIFNRNLMNILRFLRNFYDFMIVLRFVEHIKKLENSFVNFS